MKNEIKSMNLDTSKITDENSSNGNNENGSNATSLTIMKKTKSLRLLQEQNKGEIHGVTHNHNGTADAAEPFGF